VNMSYCRFENTLEDLRDCADALSEGPPSPETPYEERLARWKLLRLCVEIAENYSDEAEWPKPKRNEGE
jgi:hypothetical protein